MNKVIGFRADADKEVLVLKKGIKHEHRYREHLLSLDNMPDGMIYRPVRDLNIEALSFDYVSGMCEKLLDLSGKEELINLLSDN